MVAWVRWVTAIAVLAVSAFFLTDNEGPLHLTLGLAALVVGLWILRSIARASVIARRMPRTLRSIAVALAAFAQLVRSLHASARERRRCLPSAVWSRSTADTGLANARAGSTARRRLTSR